MHTFLNRIILLGVCKPGYTTVSWVVFYANVDIFLVFLSSHSGTRPHTHLGQEPSNADGGGDGVCVSAAEGSVLGQQKLPCHSVVSRAADVAVLLQKITQPLATLEHVFSPVADFHGSGNGDQLTNNSFYHLKITQQ